MPRMSIEIRKVLLLAAPVSLAAAMPAAALPRGDPPSAATTEVVLVGHHCQPAGGGHHTIHGSDTYFDNKDNSGVLFKSFVTGTLFSRDDDTNDQADRPPPSLRKPQ
jgi:hypothetical protein